MIPPAQLSGEEAENLLQTVEMFEAVTQTSPNDTPSLEILKEAYWKLGKTEKAKEVMRRLADTYMQLGKFSAAALEYEELLAKDPQSAEIQLLASKARENLSQPADSTSAELDLGPDLSGFNKEALEEQKQISFQNDGNEALAQFLIKNNLAPEQEVQRVLKTVSKANQNLEPNTLASSLLEELSKGDATRMEALLCGILESAKLAYIPLENYDVDRQILRMLPENLNLGRLIVPFDLVSRTLMVAMANPFDESAKQAVQQLYDFHIQWHLASPAAIIKVLRDSYHLDAKKI